MEGEAPATPGSRKLALQLGNCQHYFALDHPLAAICASFPNDPAMSAARHYCRGLRIIRQPKWECLATFICSSMKQVAHIRQISKALRERFGVARTRSIVTWLIRFPPRGDSLKVRERTAEMRTWLSREESSRNRADRRLRRGGSRRMVGDFRMPICEKNSAHCQGSGQRLRIVSCYLPTNVCALSR